jgi:metal-responsive CopG/Arc/MetJ family transcriptional regulator
LVAKVLISIDDKLLRRIDRAAKASGLSRSAYLARLAQQDLLAASGRAASSRQSALARLDRLFESAPAGEATAEIRSERDAR